MQLSRIVAFPFAVAAVYLAYHLYYNNWIEWSYYLVIPILAMVTIYVFHNQINAQGWKWWPPKIDRVLVAVADHSIPYVRNMDESGRLELFQNLLYDVRRTEFIGMKVDDIPEDVKAMSVLPGTILSYLTGAPLLNEYNKVILYQSPFPSPQYHEWHTSEIHHEDGVVLFSLEHLIPGYSRPNDFINIAFYEWAKALCHHHPPLKEWKVDQDHWDRLKVCAPLSKDLVRAYIGLEDIDLSYVVICGFFTHPEVIKDNFKAEYLKLIEVFSERHPIA